MMKRNAFLTFCFALVPGFGQMYQGYMKRGVSLLFWFCASIGLAVATQVTAFLFLLPVIWAYAFFDTFNIRHLSEEQRDAFGDNYIPGAVWLNKVKVAATKGDGPMVKVIGWGCIVLGVLILFNLVQNFVVNYIQSYFPALGSLIYRLPALVIAVLVILLGIRMLAGRRRKNGEGPAGNEGSENDA